MRTFIATYHPHYKELIYIGIPIVIGQIGIVLVGLADNIMVGWGGTTPSTWQQRLSSTAPLTSPSFSA